MDGARGEECDQFYFHCFPKGFAALPTDYCSLPAGQHFTVVSLNACKVYSYRLHA